MVVPSPQAPSTPTNSPASNEIAHGIGALLGWPAEKNSRPPLAVAEKAGGAAAMRYTATFWRPWFDSSGTLSETIENLVGDWNQRPRVVVAEVNVEPKLGTGMMPTPTLITTVSVLKASATVSRTA
jgi:hypothetical protein